MNIHNNDIEPFEDVFRDRFTDFESEPDSQLWQKIEPKLPVDATRKFPYWQTSAVVILLLLTGFWIFQKKDSDDVVTKKNDSQRENINSPLSVSPQTTEQINPPLSVSPQTTAQSLNVKSEEKILSHESSVRTQTTAVTKIRELELSVEKHIAAGKEEKSSLFSNLNTTIKTSTASLIKTEENNFLNNDNTLNLLSVNNSNEKRENISNNSSVLSVFSTKEGNSFFNKNYLQFLDSKSYSLLKNNLKTPRIKFVLSSKKDDYFKERKPLEIYTSVMPLLNYYTITPNGNDANYVHSIAVNNDENRLGFYAQAGLNFILSDKVKLRTGLTFTRTNHSISYQIRTDSLIIQPSDKQGIDVSFEEKKANYSQVANYLGTKIDIQYTFLEGEAISHYLSAGLEGAYRLNGIKRFNGFANFAYGVTRQIGDNAYLFIEPTFSYSLNQQSDNSAFLLVKPNKIGFNIGVNFKIK